jgi:hypothetical protein
MHLPWHKFSKPKPIHNSRHKRRTYLAENCAQLKFIMNITTLPLFPFWFVFQFEMKFRCILCQCPQKIYCSFFVTMIDSMEAPHIILRWNGNHCIMWKRLPCINKEGLLSIFYHLMIPASGDLVPIEILISLMLQSTSQKHGISKDMHNGNNRSP